MKRTFMKKLFYGIIALLCELLMVVVLIQFYDTHFNIVTIIIVIEEFLLCSYFTAKAMDDEDEEA